MARPWRIQYEGAIYHVMSRGVGRGKIFLANDDYSRFLKYVASAKEKFNLDIFAFILMGNHYHILLRTNEANLSRAMQWIQTAYSIYYNRNHKRSGHLFQGRFKSILVENETYLQVLSVYIHLNPLRAGMVEKLREYKWSSYHDYVSVKKKNKWVSSEAVLEGICSNKQDSRRGYRRLIRGASGRENGFLEEIKYGMILGSDRFLKWVQRKYIDRTEKEDIELPQKKKISDDGMVERVIEKIVHSYGVDRTMLLQRKRRIPFEARDVSMYILKTYTGLTNKAVGELFGVSISAVNKAALRICMRRKTS
ncbi:MAG: hypothetical protein GY775_06415, partial [Candidatus Scalindua sp.]|nr:hypothetical protein [Candidatus Scalindua sp.]